jgi:prolyl-tRNA editing enzyme YbaK/EbsC (Cys-tRNA(Pro) deacylase)
MAPRSRYALEAAEKLGLDPARLFKTLLVAVGAHGGRLTAARVHPSVH